MAKQKNNEEDLKDKLLFATYLLNAKTAIEYCLDIPTSANTKDSTISMGLMTKLYKIFNSMMSNIERNDNTAALSMIRIYYETSLTIQYLLRFFKEEDFDEFMLTDAIRRRNLIKMYETSPIFKNDKYKKMKDEHVKLLEKSIIDDGFKIEELPNKSPSSWHRKKSYLTFAKELGDIENAVFYMSYTAGSSFIHPSWTDLKHHHLMTDPKTKLIRPNKLVSRPTKEILSVIIDETLKCCAVYSGRYRHGDYADRLKTMHTTFHKTFSQSV